MEDSFDTAVHALRAGDHDADAAAAEVVRSLTDRELLGILDGDEPLWRGMVKMARAYNSEPVVAGAVPRLGIPGIRFTDGPRGIVMGRSTGFPAAIARGATWDPGLEERVGRAIGAEGRAQGANLFAGVCVNLVRHPGWGRTQESYGEDPLLLGAMGAGLTRGVRNHLMACVKHYALNSMEEARFKVDVRVDEATLHEVYLPHFRTVIDAGAEALMSAYNSVNGEWAGENAMLLTDVLRDEWRFGGFVMTDFVWGLRDPVASVSAGQDLEMPFAQQRARTLPAALADGRLRRADAERAATRVVGTQIRHAAERLPEAPSASVVACDEHRALAREAAAQGAVLLRNEEVGNAPALPLAPDQRASVAVIGKRADRPNLGDTGSSQVRPPATCSILDGVREALGAGAVHHHDGSDVPAAAAVAAAARTAVVVVGLGAGDEGESFIATDPDALQVYGPPFTRPRFARLIARLLRRLGPRLHPGGGDRRDLRLHAADEGLIRAVAAANPRTVVVVVAGSIVVMESWRHRAPAILLAWYPGMEGGRAVADLLLGEREPGGRLPLAIPTSQDHLPDVDWDADRITYGRWWGQRKLDRDGHEPAYPFGFGLGYTTFQLDHLAVDSDERIAHVTVCNTGARAGATVVQLYAHDAAAADGGRRSELVGFARVALGAGETTTVAISIELRPLSRRDRRTRRWSIPEGDWRLRAAQHARDAGIETRLGSVTRA